MRKRIVPGGAIGGPGTDAEASFLDLEATASVEVTSEDPAHPIEGALVGDDGGGWRASHPGEQTVVIRFDAPQRLRRIAIRFVETSVERTQELAIAWSADGRVYREVVRQRWNFSPRGATREDEDYRVDLVDARSLRVAIRPDVSGGEAIASIARLRLA